MSRRFQIPPCAEKDHRPKNLAFKGCGQIADPRFVCMPSFAMIDGMLERAECDGLNDA